MESEETVRRELDRVAELLRRDTEASRVTVRLDSDAWGFTVNDLAAESRGETVKSLRGETALDQRSLATVKFMEQHRDLLIQSDCSTAQPPAPPELISIYGVTAQMLAPLIRKQELMGWISVHETRGPRAWNEDETQRLRAAAEEVTTIIDRAERGDTAP